jgi:succinyl-CoA synthetase beta subunit
MKIYEYQARELLRGAGIPVPPGAVISYVADAPAAYREVRAKSGTDLAVVKGQVHAGGRGKAGFVKMVRSEDEASTAAAFMLSNRMKSPQTPPEGLEVKKLLVAAGVDILERAGGGAEEFYLAITTDRKQRRNILIASRQGGVDIEHVAETNPDAIIKEALHPVHGVQGFQARKIAYQIGFTGKLASQAADVIQKLGKLYIEKDCTLAEINPLVIAKGSDGEPAVMAIDAKFSFDENGLFRHKELQALEDPAVENAAEMKAQHLGLSYVALDGNIGCLVNGAGLAMATMDIIKLHGGEPANFLDVGGGASEEAVTGAFSIILSDPSVQGVLVNIFGGIMRCDVIAQGIINAARNFQNADGSTGFKVPLVVRLEGTNVQRGRELLDAAQASIPTMQSATDLSDAASKVCKAVKG